MLIKRYWINHKNVEEARKLLEKAIEINPNNEKLLLAFCKFEKNN